MKITNPCRICIVKPMCNRICPDREDLGKTYLKVCQILSLGITFICIISILTAFIDLNTMISKIVNIALFFTAVVSIACQLILRNIRKTNEMMFKRRFKKKRVYGFDRSKGFGIYE